MYYAYTNTPIGTLLLIGNDKAVTGIHWVTSAYAPTIGTNWIEDKSLFKDVVRQLDEYFAGKRTAFDIPYELRGTPFQMQVWEALNAIPYGEQSTYQDIANIVGKPKAVRAVGTAVGKNPLCIVIPCHRVLASSGSVGGYVGGVACKRQLLALEQNAAKA